MEEQTKKTSQQDLDRLKNDIDEFRKEIDKMQRSISNNMLPEIYSTTVLPPMISALTAMERDYADKQRELQKRNDFESKAELFESMIRSQIRMKSMNDEQAKEILSAISKFKKE